MTIRLLDQNDLDAFIELRRYGLEESPRAFSASLDDDITNMKPAMSFKFKNFGPHEFIVGAFDNNKMIGLTGMFSDPEKSKTKHKGELWGVYVLPQYRGTGVSTEMLARVLEEVRKSGIISQLNLGVGSYNLPAIKAYTRAGFTQYGLEKGALLVNGEFVDELLMVLFF